MCFFVWRGPFFELSYSTTPLKKKKKKKKNLYDNQRVQENLFFPYGDLQLWQWKAFTIGPPPTSF